MRRALAPNVKYMYELLLSLSSISNIIFCVLTVAQLSSKQLCQAFRKWIATEILVRWQDWNFGAEKRSQNYTHGFINNFKDTYDWLIDWLFRMWREKERWIQVHLGVIPYCFSLERFVSWSVIRKIVKVLSPYCCAPSKEETSTIFWMALIWQHREVLSWYSEGRCFQEQMFREQTLYWWSHGSYVEEKSADIDWKPS